MARALAALALSGVLVVASGCGSDARRPAIRILDWRVIGSAVILKVKVDGWKMAAPRQGPVAKPRTGQWQIFADDRYAGFSYDPSYGTVNDLGAGAHTIWVALARTDASLVYPLIRSRAVSIHIGGDGA